MAPEYGATMGFFPVDDATVDYLRATGRTDAETRRVRRATSRRRACSACRAPARSTTRKTLTLDLAVDHAVGRRPEAPAGPHRARRSLKSRFTRALQQARRPRTASRSRRRRLRTRLRRGRRAQGAARSPTPSLQLARQRPAARRRRDGQQPPDARSRHAAAPPRPVDIGNGDVLIAAITSCTNTSNPSVLLAAGLLAKKAVEKGLDRQAAHQDLARAGLARRHRLPDQDGPAALPREARLRRRRLRLHDLHRQRRRPHARDQRGDHHERPGLRRRALGQPQLRGAHPPEPQGQLPASPPLVVAYAIAGTRAEGPDDRAARQRARDGPGVPARHLADARTRSPRCCGYARDPAIVPQALRRSRQREPAVEGRSRARPARSTTGRHRPTSPKPPFFEGFTMQPAAIGDIKGARALGIFGDSVTTDHISPGRLDQADVAGGPVPAGERRRRSPTSTATARAAATTK